MLWMSRVCRLFSTAFWVATPLDKRRHYDDAMRIVKRSAGWHMVR